MHNFGWEGTEGERLALQYAARMRHARGGQSGARRDYAAFLARHAQADANWRPAVAARLELAAIEHPVAGSLR